jgi:trimethylamine--corrinoid protein Co-methyltransferase
VPPGHGDTGGPMVAEPIAAPTVGHGRGETLKTLLQVLSEDERHQVHERSLRILAHTGVRVDTAQGRQFLGDAGAQVDEESHVVRFPQSLVEEALRLAPKEFSLGARRPGHDLRMNGGDCFLIPDGEAMFALDRETGERRPGTTADWLAATRLADALDEIGVYWHMVEENDRGDGMGEYVSYLGDLFRNFSKHVQDAISRPEQAPWLLEVLQVIHGDRESIRRRHPLSFLLCPQSPLVIEGPYTDAYLALLGWDIPVAVMPMPLMGATGPGSLVSTAVVGNSEVLAMLCLIQTAAPGTPFIYAPALATMNPRTGGYSGGAIENGLMGAAAVEMGRYYGLPVEGTGIGTDHHVPSIQSSYERALNGVLPLLAWPDLLVGPGLLGGSMILCLEQMLVDVEVFRMFKRARQGIASEPELWLEEVIARAGPGEGFIAEPSTVKGIRGGEWHIPKLGLHDTYEAWEAAGKPTLLAEARERVDSILATYEPWPWDEAVDRELARIQRQAQEVA